MSSPQDEKLAFALRLKQALKRSKKKIDTPTELALQFNLLYQGDSITQQSAQKWLTGLNRPAPDKIETLAAWLNVSPQWLRYGIAEERPQITVGRKPPKGKTAAAIEPTADEIKLLARIRALPEHRRYLVNEIVDQFALEQEMWLK
ncbi:putative transcriptional regulator [Collimonas arenae]|uniref:Putative transcriptional regulator n=1 Tax=Collimonas arenae TaxID=279058 RepID=A0A0A1F8B2_9BURK|nr:transcriptional regulator [Collimonas arenae]AIY39904.1 putative transcriptional regulator [Collimonas arenae]